MRANFKRTTSLLASVALLVGAVVIYSSLIKPAHQEITDLRGRLVAQSRQLAEQQAVLTQVQNLLTQYRGAAQIRDAVSLALPLGEEIPSIFNQLQALARANSMALETLDIQSLPTKGVVTTRGVGSVVKDVAVLQISLKIGGGYENLKNFLAGMETNIRLMDVVNLKVEPGRDGPPTYALVVNTYYQLE